MAGSSDPTKRAVSVLKEAITKLEESYHLASSSTSDNSSDAVGMASTSASTSSTSREDARRDFRRLFPGLCSRNVTRRPMSTAKPSATIVRPAANNPPQSKKPKLKGYEPVRFTPLETWTHDICVLGRCDENVTPDRQRMDVLMQAGLGKMKLVFPNKKASHIEVENFLEEKFPRLRDGGGIEVFRAVGGGGGQRPLHYVPPGREGYTVAHLRERFSQAAVYIRPLQSDLDESPFSYEDSDDGYPDVTCMFCGVNVPFSTFKSHKEKCQDPKNEKLDLPSNCVIESFTDESKQQVHSQLGSPQLGSLDQLIQMFPSHEVTFLKDVLDKNGTISDAVADIVGDQDTCNDNLPISDVTSTLKGPNCASTLKEALKESAREVYGSCNSKNKNKLRINVRRGKVWSDTFEIVRGQDKSDFYLPLNVRFTGEEAVDLGGPTREFFSVLFQGLEQQRIVAGSSPFLTFSHDILAYERKEYEIFGVLVALSLLNGCSGPHNLSPSLVHYLLNQEKQCCKFKIEEIPNPDIRAKCLKIQETSGEKDFSDNVQALDERFDAGFNKASVSLNDKEKLLQTMAYHYVINICHDEILQFKQGLSFGGVLNVLRRFPKESFTELTDSTESVITPEDLTNIFEANLSTRGSNLRIAEEDILYNWENFLSNVFRGKVSQTTISIEINEDVDTGNDNDKVVETQSTKVVTLNDIVMFSTGSYHLPATGFERKVEIDFEHDPPEGKRVTANTCGPSISFPVSPRYTSDLETFCTNVAEDIFSSPGFGCV